MAASLPLWGFWYHPTEVHEQDIYSTGSLRWLQGEPLSSTKVAGVFHCGGSVEAYQDQIMVCVVAGILDRDVLEHTVVRYQKVVCLGLHLPDSVDYDPLPPVLQQQIELWEEMGSHVLQPWGGKGRHDIFVPRFTFRLGQVLIEVSVHLLRRMGCNNAIYGQGVVRRGCSTP